MTTPTPHIQDAFWEVAFAVGPAFLRAAESGCTDRKLYEEHKEFWKDTALGLTLISWCHFVETFFGNRDEYISFVCNEHDKKLVRMLFYARNAYVHCAWDISKLDQKLGQEKKLRDFVGNGYSHREVKVVGMDISPASKLEITGLMNMAHYLNKQM